MEDFGKLEYRVKKVERYIITRFVEDASNTSGSVSQRGEYENPDVAWEVAYALCKMEHERMGYPPADERIQYPRHPKEDQATQAA